MRIGEKLFVLFFTLLWVFGLSACGPKKQGARNLRTGGNGTANAIPSVFPDETPSIEPTPEEFVPSPEDLIETETETNGWEGEKGTYEAQFTSEEGITTDYFISIPSDSGLDKPYGLLIHLHDGGIDEYTKSQAKIKQSALSHDLIPLVVKAPSSSRQWFVDGIENSAFLDELLKTHIFTKHNIAKKRVFFVGKGSGSTFLSSHFIPTTSKEYTGGAILLCGGNINWTLSSNFRTDVDNMPLYFHTEAQDYVHPQVAVAVDFYQQAGQRVIFKSPPGDQHCGFDLSETTTQILGQLLATN